MKKFLLAVLTVALLSGLVACGPEVLQLDKQRVTNPDVNEVELATLVDGNSAFAFDLYQELREADGNLFYSPYSISLALAMTYAGARGETEQQMAGVLHFDLSQEQLHPAFNGLDSEIGRHGKDKEGFRLNIVNALWGQKDYGFLPEFLDILAENYGAGVRIVDFIKTPEESRITINNWVSDQTEGRIENLIPRGIIDTLTRLVLTNTIYFNAKWEYPFLKESYTKDGPFHLLDGSEVTVPMMRSEVESFGYAEGGGYQAVELPYEGSEISMVVLLPQSGQFKIFEKSLDSQLVYTIVSDLETAKVKLTMPRFKFESTFFLKKTLSEMGMPVAFGNADFSGMTGNYDLFIRDVVHKAWVSVDESGTEAAAASAVVVVIGLQEDIITVNINRPFIFLIRDIETGTILFVGRVLNPLES